jgi:hypothetical protein
MMRKQLAPFREAATALVTGHNRLLAAGYAERRSGGYDGAAAGDPHSAWDQFLEDLGTFPFEVSGIAA